MHCEGLVECPLCWYTESVGVNLLGSSDFVLSCYIQSLKQMMDYFAESMITE